MEKKAIEEDLKIVPGVGATETVGSDSYPYYVSEVLPKGIIGMYAPNSHFEKSWADGDMVVDPFDEKRPTEFYIKRRYGKWWTVKRDGTPVGRFTGRYVRLSFGHACSYRDPSF